MDMAVVLELLIHVQNICNEKKALRETQTLCTGCSKAEPKISPCRSPLRCKESALAVVRQSQNLCPTADPLPGGTGRPKFNQLEMVITFTYRPSLVKI